MEGGAKDRTNGEIAMTDARKEGSTDPCSSSGSGGYRLFDRKRPIHQIVGDGKGTFYRSLFLAFNSSTISRLHVPVRKYQGFMPVEICECNPPKGTVL